MSAVHISGTFKKDERSENGLEAIAEELVKDELSQRLIVGIVVPHAFKKIAGEAMTPTVRIIAVEVVDGNDAGTVRDLINSYRAKRHQTAVQDSLPFVGDYPAETDDSEDPDDDHTGNG